MNNATLVVLVHCLIYFVGNSIDCLSIAFGIFDFYPNQYFFIVGNFLFFTSHGLNFFVYFYFNKTFKRKFYRKFCFRKFEKYEERTRTNTRDSFF